MIEKRKVFLTGVTGLLGSNLVKELLDQGYHVKAIIRDINKYQGLPHPRLELINGDLTRISTADHLQDVNICIHIAAITAQHFTSYVAYYSINVEATKRLYEACKMARVQKFIFVSSANSMGYGSILHPGDESQPMRSPFTDSLYARSKKDAEDFLSKQDDGLYTIIINPTFMLGGMDSKPSSGKIILRALRKKLLFYPPGGKNFVAVKDVCNAIIQSIDLGKHGHRYLISHENMSYKKFYKRLNKLVNQNPIMIKIPKEFLMILGFIGSAMRLINIQTSLSITNVKILCIQNYFTNKKSVDALQMKYTDIDEAMTDAVRYFEEHHII